MRNRRTRLSASLFRIVYHGVPGSINTTPEMPGVFRVQSFRDAEIRREATAMAIEMTGGVIVDERGTVVTFRQKCESCGYVFDWNKTTIVPAYSSRKVRPFTCPECGNYQEVELRYLYKGPGQTPT